MLLDDKPTDFISDRVDIAFRNGRLEDTHHCEADHPDADTVCASPEYRTPTIARQRMTAINASIPLWDGPYPRMSSVEGLVLKLQPQAKITYHNDPSLVLQAARRARHREMAGYWPAMHSARCARSGLARYAPDDRDTTSAARPATPAFTHASSSTHDNKDRACTISA